MEESCGVERLMRIPRDERDLEVHQIILQAIRGADTNTPVFRSRNDEVISTAKFGNRRIRIPTVSNSTSRK